MKSRSNSSSKAMKQIIEVKCVVKIKLELNGNGL